MHPCAQQLHSDGDVQGARDPGGHMAKRETPQHKK